MLVRFVAFATLILSLWGPIGLRAGVPTAPVADAAYGSGQHSRTVGRQGKGASSRPIPLRSATLMPVAKMLTGDHNAEYSLTRAEPILTAEARRSSSSEFVPLVLAVCRCCYLRSQRPAQRYVRHGPRLSVLAAVSGGLRALWVSAAAWSGTG